MDIAPSPASEARTHLITRSSATAEWVQSRSSYASDETVDQSEHWHAATDITPDPVKSAVNAAARLRTQSRYQEAAAILRAMLDESGEKLSEPERASVHSGLAVTCHEAGQLEAALEHYMHGIDQYQKAGSRAHAAVLFRLYNNLAMICRVLGRVDEAELAYITAVEFHDTHIGSSDPVSLAALYGNLAFLYHETGMGDAACDMQRLAVEMLKQHAQDDKPERVNALRRAGIFAASAGRHAEAVRSFEAARALLATVPKIAESLHVELLVCEASSSLALELNEDALALYERASTALQRRAHPDELLLALIENSIGCILLRQNRAEHALTALNNAHDLLRAHPAADLVARAEVLHNLALTHELLGNHKAAVQFRTCEHALLASVSEEVRLMLADCEARGQSVPSSHIHRHANLKDQAYVRLPSPPPSLRNTHPTGKLVIPLRSETIPV